MTESELDTLLRDWAARHELSTARSEAIRAIAHPPTPALPRGWWKGLFQGMSQTLRESTDPRRYPIPVPNS